MGIEGVMQELRTGAVIWVALLIGLALGVGAAGDEAAPAAAEASTETVKPADAAGEKPAEGTPPSPFGASRINDRPDALSGVVELSDGTQVPGDIFTTRGQDLVILDAERKTDRWRRVPPASIRTIETRVEWERMDPEWRFKTAGDPEKVYTGKSYPNRSYSYVVTLRDESKITGTIHGVPLYVRPTGGEPRLFVLHERHKGEVGTELKDLVYVKAVRFGDELRRKVEADLAAKAAAKQAAEKAAAEKEQTNKEPATGSAATKDGE